MTLDLRPVAATPSALIVASHRGPFAKGADGSWSRKVNGVFAAMDPTLRDMGGTWVCWALPRPEHEGEEGVFEVVEDGERLYGIHELVLAPEKANAFYEGFTTEALWPILFSFPSRIQFTHSLWDTYREVNERFADSIAGLAAPGATVWIHDFHLMLLPGLLRERRPDLRIGFFLHTAFPPPDVFGILPWRDELLNGILGADLAGFHIPLYANNFAACCVRYLGARPTWRILPDGGGSPLHPGLEYERLSHGKRVTELGAFGVGAQAPLMAELSRDPSVRERAQELRRQVGVEVLALAAERLDYVKGPLERLRALDRFFERHPDWLGRLTLVQVAVPTREGVEAFEQLRREVNEAVGALNGRWGNATWQPVLSLARGLPLPELVAHYLASDLCLVTPLRDGMNLVAKEYALCREDGLVLLSEFAGAAVDLPEAHRVNPFDPEGVAEAMHAALSMPTDERKARFTRMKARCEAKDLAWWGRAFLRRLEEVALAPA